MCVIARPVGPVHIVCIEILLFKKLTNTRPDATVRSVTNQYIQPVTWNFMKLIIAAHMTNRGGAGLEAPALNPMYAYVMRTIITVILMKMVNRNTWQ